MSLTRLPVVWVPRPEGDEEDASDAFPYIGFRVRETWVATDADQLLLPITLTERDGNTLDEPRPALLKQYGGESLLNDLLMLEGEVDRGDRFLLEWNPATNGFTITRLEDD